MQHTYLWLFVVLFQAEDGIRDLVRSRGLGDVYKRQSTDGVTDGDFSTIVKEVELVSNGTTFENTTIVDLSLIHI